MGKRSLISGFRLPPGFRFHPTDEELVMYYLKRKVMGRKIHHPEAISEVDIYNYPPWELPPKSCLGTGDRKWYFFCPSEKKYSSGVRMKRSTDLGYWKATGKDRAVCYNKEVVGMIKTLVFHRGKAPKGERTDWVMYEYRLQEKRLTDRGVAQDVYVLCVIFKKDGPGPKNGAQYGAPFKEEDWDDDDDQEEDVMMEEKNAGEAAVSTDLSSPVFVLPNNPSISEVVEERNGSEVGVSTSLYAPGYVQPVNQRIPEVVWERNGSEFSSSTVLSANLCVSNVVEKMKGGEDISSGVPVLQMQINPSSPDSMPISSHVSCQPNTLPSADMNVLMVSDNDGTSTEAPLAAHDDGDIFAMLDAFSVDHNVSHEVPDLRDGVTKADSSLDGIDISTDLGDLRNLSGFDELTNNMFSCYGNDEYLELRDLTVPLNFPTEVARHEHVQAGDLCASNNYYSNF